MQTRKVERGLYWSESSKTWHYTVRIKGKLYSGDTRYNKKSFALEYLNELRAKLKPDKYNITPQDDPPTLAQALDMWAISETGSLTEKHIQERLTTVTRHCKPALDIPLSNLNTLRLDELKVEYLSSTWKVHNSSSKIEIRHTPGGWNRIRRHLIAIVNWCIERELMRERPFKGKPIKTQEKVRPVIWPEDVFAFLAIVKGLTKSQHIQTAIRLMIQLGLRENEALSARWEDFDERQNIYRPAKTKNRETREIALPPGLLDYLKKNHPGSREGLIMPGLKSDNTTPHRVGFTASIIEWAGILMGIKGLHPHALRATFATAHWEAGTTLDQITSMLGHKDPRTTMIYVRQRAKDTSESQRKVAINMGLEKQ